MYTGCCALPIVDSAVIIEKNSEIQCEVEGSHITYYCPSAPASGEFRTAYCMKDGNWDPYPSDLKCHPITPDNTTQGNFINLGMCFNTCSSYKSLTSAMRVISF